MKKIFTILAAAMTVLCAYAADITVALSQMTPGTGSYSYEGTEVVARKNNVYIELPADQIKGEITIYGSSDKPDRFLYIYAEAGTVKDATRAIVMQKTGVTIAYSSSDIVTVESKPYLLFATPDDFKFKKFDYTYEADKQIVSTVETLTAVSINDFPIAAADFTTLVSEHTLILEDSAYATAPVVKFNKHIVITYEDATTQEKDEVIAKTSQQSQAAMWGAWIDVAGVEYSVYTIKAVGYTVTYMMMDENNEIVLGTEVVKAGGHPAEYAQYEVRPLCTFNDWYDADNIETVDLSEVVVNSDMSFYADFDKAFAQSIDFEQMVLNQGKSYDVKSALAANFYDYKDIDALDSLNNDKGAGRNEPYLGLKIKKQGGYIACNVLPGTTLRIKSGYVAETVWVIAGNDTMRLTPTDNKLGEMEFPIMVETLVKLQTTSGKTVVIKQIMVDDPIVTWMYPITYEAAEHGKVEGWTIAFPHEDVTITATPDKGYRVSDVKVNGVSINAQENVYSFIMPGEEVTVSATFEVEDTAVDNTEAAVKTVKVVRDGHVLILRDGKIFNLMGAELN